MSLVDVVVPCFNAEATLAATLESVLGQEGIRSVLVVDDGSADGSLELAGAYALHLAVLTGPNRGVAAARNRGAAEGRAEWLLFLDSDDLLTPGSLPRRLAAVRAGGADVVICDWEEFIDGDEAAPGRPRSLDWPAIRADPELAVALAAWAPPAAVLYRRALFARTGGFRGDVSPIEDVRMIFDAARLGARFVHAPHTGARYRIRAGSLSRADPAQFWRSVLRNGQEIESAWREDERFDAARRLALSGLYNTAARGLFRSGDPAYFAAIEALRRLGFPEPLHGRIAAPLARLLGLRAARALLSIAGRP